MHVATERQVGFDITPLQDQDWPLQRLNFGCRDSLFYIINNASIVGENPVESKKR